MKIKYVYSVVITGVCIILLILNYQLSRPDNINIDKNYIIERDSLIENIKNRDSLIITFEFKLRIYENEVDSLLNIKKKIEYIYSKNYLKIEENTIEEDLEYFLNFLSKEF